MKESSFISKLDFENQTPELDLLSIKKIQAFKDNLNTGKNSIYSEYSQDTACFD